MRSVAAGEAEALLLDDREHVAGGEDEVLLVVVLDLGAAVLAVDHDVTDLDVERHALGAVLVETARAYREDGALLRLLLGGVGDDEARGRRLLRLERLDEDAVLERLDGDLGSGRRHVCDLPMVRDVLHVAGRLFNCSGFPTAPGERCRHRRRGDRAGSLVGTLTWRVPTRRLGGCLALGQGESQKGRRRGSRRSPGVALRGPFRPTRPRVSGAAMGTPVLA